MTQSWDRITALFGAARLLDPDTRAAFLEAACREDPGLRDEVERLVAESAREDSFLAEPHSLESFALTALGSPLSPGQVVKERYRIDAKIASGGQGLVYRATDTVLSRPVIVKVIRTAGRQNRLLTSRFEHEMKALSQIDHPGVVGIFDVGELAAGCPFLVMQYVNGVSLREELQKGPLEAARTARLLRELASALGAAHAAGVAHRDLKPENIMVQRFDDGSETLKLIDFGISNVEGLPAVSCVVVAGTVRYMAPEQFRGEHSTASDVYALAIVVCEMLCGYPDSRALPESVGVEVKKLIDAALAFRPEERPRDVRRWCERLAGSLTTIRRSRLRERWWIGAAAVAAIVAGTEGAREVWHQAAPIAASRFVVHQPERRSSSDGTDTPQNLTGDWSITGILVVCGFMCGSPVGTVYHSVATLSQDTPTTFHGTYFGYPVQGTVSGNSISFGFDNYPIPALTVKSDCVGTIAGSFMTLKCSEYFKPNSGSEFQLNGTRTDTVVKKEETQ